MGNVFWISRGEVTFYSILLNIIQPNNCWAIQVAEVLVYIVVAIYHHCALWQCTYYIVQCSLMQCFPMMSLFTHTEILAMSIIRPTN